MLGPLTREGACLAFSPDGNVNPRATPFLRRTVNLTTPMPGPTNSITANIVSLIGESAWTGQALTYSFPTRVSTATV